MGELAVPQRKGGLSSFFSMSPKLEIEVSGLDIFAFELPVNDFVGSIELSLEDVNHLHLSEIDLQIDGSWVSLRDGICSSFSSSSVMRNEDRFSLEAWLSGKSSFFSTKKESQPSVRFVLEDERFVQSIRLLNRRDGLWERSRNIQVSLESSRSASRCVFDGASFTSVRKFLYRRLGEVDQSVVQSILGLQAARDLYWIGFSLNSGVSYHLLRARISKMIERASVALENSLHADFDSYHSASAEIWKLCSIWMQIVDRPSSALRRGLISSLILSDKGRHAFRYFKHTIREWDANDVSELENLVGYLGQKRDGIPLIVGAHDFTRSLRSYPKSVLFGTIIDVLEVCKQDDEIIDSMICYGTLLGLYRDGDFIEHDDDIDLLAIVDANLWGNVEPLISRLKQALRARGLRVKETSTNDSSKTPLLQIFSNCHPVNVDLFFGFLQEESVNLPMAKVRYSRIPARQLLPVQNWVYGDYTFDAPAEIEEFLISRYGSSWPTPDPLFRASEYKKK
ncbi:LicD family protein [Microbulbifer sp. MCCC 1A16149]|uniref:LicD family protein n=1 Tax=Microbulbifer sp. MCCC 1A16149 TaxID=3411322 RepID=UPI003D0D97BC